MLDVRMVETRSLSWVRGVWLHFLRACLLPARTGWEASSTPRVHHTCERARGAMRMGVSIRCVRGIVVEENTASVVFARCVSLLSLSAVVSHCSSVPSA